MRLRWAAALATVGVTALVGIAVPLVPARTGTTAPCPRSIAGQDLERQEVDDGELPGARGLSCFYEDASVLVLYFVTDEGTTGSCTDDARDRLAPEFTLYDPERARRVVVSGTVREGEPRPFIDAGYALLEAYAPLAAPCVAEVATTEAQPADGTAVTAAAGAEPADDDLSEEALFLAVGIIMIALGISWPWFFRVLRSGFGLRSDAELEAKYGPLRGKRDT